MMNIVVAPDSFKGSLSALEVGKAITAGVLRAKPTTKIRIIPMADGGEGTLEAILTAVNGTKIAVSASDPLGRKMDAYIGVLEDETCIVELAQAAGLYLLSPSERNPLVTSTYGFGQCIKAGLDHGCRKFILALGGSATNDAGLGMLQALGYRFLNKNREEVGAGGVVLDQIDRIDISQADERLAQSTFIVASDVDNPFIGPNGASKVYAPQKGASPKIVEQLEHNLTHFANLLQATMQVNIHDVPGAGAAGGVAGAILAFLPARLESGAKVIAQITGLEQAIAGTDLVITGEGKIDGQTMHGKTVYHIAQIAKKHAVPTVAFVGSIGDGIDVLYRARINGHL